MHILSHDDQAFGDLLRRHRVFAGMSQEELAARAGLSARAISDLERGVKRVPRRDTVQLLVEALQLSGEVRAAFVHAAREPAARPHPVPRAENISATSTDNTSTGLTVAQPSAPQRGISTPQAALPIGGFLGARPEHALIGRQGDVATALADVEAVMSGAGRLMVIAGEPGVGKTRLAQETMLACRDRGFLVATGRCYEPHRAVSYYPFLEALSALHAATPEPMREEIPVRWPALPRLLPTLYALPAPAAGASPREEQQRLFWAVTTYVQALADTAPVALLLDDLHWADDASLALIQHLARHTRVHRVLLLCTYRDVEVGRQHPLGKALRDLEREHLVNRISVRRLGTDDTTHLIAARMGQDISDDFTRLIHRHTDGNPLFVQEVLRALVERGDVYRRDGRWERKEIAAIEVPESVRATIADRVSRLSEPAQETLRDASVLGQTFTFADVLEMHAMGKWERSEEELDAALEEAQAAGLVQENRDGYLFNHALTQQTLYTELPSRRRRRLHVAAGEALERLPERTRQPRAGELAWHFREGEAPERALPYALLAGDYARSLYATGEAEREYRIALNLAVALGDRAHEARALEQLGWLMWLLARLDASAEILEHAAPKYRALEDVEGEMRTVGLLGMVYFTVAPHEGVQRITALLERLGQQGQKPSKPLASLYASLAMNLLISGRYLETVGAAERAEEIADTLGDTRMRIWAETTRGPALGMMGRLAEARRVGEEALLVAKATDDYFGQLSAVHYLGAIRVAEGDFAAAMDYYSSALELAERLGAQSRISAETANIAEALFYQGEWKRAHDLAERALEIARAASSGRTAGYFQYANVFRQVAMIRAAEGAWPQARPLLEESIALAEQLPYLEALRISQGILAEHEIESGHPDAALARLEPLIEAADPGEMGIMRLLPSFAQARAVLGDVADADRILAEGIQRATAQQHLFALVDLLRAHGTILGMQGQDRLEEAEHACDEAIALARRLRYPYAEGRALYTLGCLHGSAQRRQEAQERLAAALAIFRRLGARSDAERAEKALMELQPA